jgi:hypothetical protein
MKRIAAVIATAFALLAIPATAMASTGGPGTSSGNPWGVNPGGPILVACPLPPGVHVQVSAQSAAQITYTNGQVQVQVTAKKAGRVRLRCRFPRWPQPPTQVCTSGTVTFDMPPSGGTFTEYSGPQLYPGEEFDYNGTTYTVATVSGAAFTLQLNGGHYVNSGPSIVGGSATVTCSSSSFGSSFGN